MTRGLNGAGNIVAIIGVLEMFMEYQNFGQPGYVPPFTDAATAACIRNPGICDA